MANTNLAPAPPPGVPAAKPPGPGLPLKSPVGGASGPGSSPMVSPGGGAGMRASAVHRLSGPKTGLIHQLTELAPVFGTDKEAFNLLSNAIRDLWKLVDKGQGEPDNAAKPPIPVPGAAPGGGLGGAPGGPPSGVPQPSGGAGPISPTPE